MPALLTPSGPLHRSTWATGPAIEPDAFLRYSVREQARLSRENVELRQSCTDLTNAAETWIRLYESALARANAAEDVVAVLSRRTETTGITS